MNLKMLSVAALAAAFVPVSAQAAVITWNLANNYAGAAPTGTSPWLTITLTDTVANQVELKVQGALGGGDYLDKLNLNLAPSYAGTFTTGTVTNGGGYNSPGVTRTTNGFAASTAGNFDVQLSFTTSGSNNNQRFSSADVYTVLLNGSGGFSTSTFFTNSTGSPSYPVAAQIQSTAASYVSIVPEPTAILAVAGGAIVALRRRRA